MLPMSVCHLQQHVCTSDLETTVDTRVRAQSLLKPMSCSSVVMRLIEHYHNDPPHLTELLVSVFIYWKGMTIFHYPCLVSEIAFSTLGLVYKR